MRILGHMVVKNELGRYLRQSLEALCGICDAVMVYDDGSDDGTTEYLWGLVDRFGLWHVRRIDGRPSFAEDESRFRQDGWRFMGRALHADNTDWVLCLDADEVLVGDNDDVRQRLIDFVTINPYAVGSFPVREVFEVRNGRCFVRTDGFWGSITARRFVRYESLAEFDPRAEGGGSIPSLPKTRTCTADGLEILHFGYARPEDREAKYTRYAAGKGHNRSHVQSILKRPSLVDWGPSPI